MSSHHAVVKELLRAANSRNGLSAEDKVNLLNQAGSILTYLGQRADARKIPVNRVGDITSLITVLTSYMS